MKPVNKTQTAVAEFKRGDLKKALNIVKGFKLGVTEQERKVLSLGYECIVHPSFYQSLGKNLQECIDAAKQLFQTKFIEETV